MPACFVNGCKKVSRTSNLQKDGITFHIFPHNLLQRRRWTEACNRPKEWMPTVSSSICSRHFEANQFKATDTNRRQLKKDAIPTLLLQKHELDMANLNTSSSVIPKFLQSTSSQERISAKPAGVWHSQNEKSTSNTSEANSSTEGFKKRDIKPIEYLQMFIKQLMPNIKDDNAIYVVLVNNDKPESGSDLFANRTECFSKDGNKYEDFLRNQLEKKTELAEVRFRKMRALSQSRRRMIARNKKLKNTIAQLKKQNLINTDLKSDSEPDSRTENDDDDQ